MDTTNDIKLGQYVKSKSGRDKGRVFIVIKIVDEKYVYLVDGDLRRVEKPKLKKVKHLVLFNEVSEDLKSKIDENKKITNLMIRMEIEKLELKNSL